MSEHKLHIEQGGFINKEKLFAYLRNQLSDTEKQHIEKLMAQDPFLQDAVEGLKGADLNTIENTLSAIFAKVDSATGAQKTNIFSANLRKYAAAASIILILGMSWMIIDNLNNKQNETIEIAIEPTIISKDKNYNSIAHDDSSDMGGGSAANDSISMDELKEESLYLNRSKEALTKPEKNAESTYSFDYTENAKSEVTITTEMIITPPVMMDENITQLSKNTDGQDAAEFERVESAGSIASETITKDEKGIGYSDKTAPKKEKKIKNNAAKSDVDDFNTGVDKAPATSDTEANVLMFAEQMPTFPGGTYSLNTFIFNNLNTNCEGDKNCKEGNVFVKFIVNENGAVSNAQIIKPVSAQFDQEVLRVISTMPNWLPGVQNGVKVKVWYTLKVTIDYE